MGELFYIPLFVIFLLALTSANGINFKGSIVLQEKKLVYKPYIDDDAVAYAYFNDTTEINGWGVLDLNSESKKGKYSQSQVMYSAGMLEGILTAKRITQHYINLADFVSVTRLEDKLCNFLEKQEVWLKTQVKNNLDNPLWIQAGMVQAHLDGLIDGFNYANKSKGRCPLQLLNAAGEIIDLQYVLDPDSFPNFEEMSFQQLNYFVRNNGHCSAIVKVTPGFEDLFMGHSSWFLYNGMLRIYKNYNIQPFEKHYANGKFSFSSYPGYLESLDDFYLLGSQMVMLQTTNNIFNKTLYNLVKPESLLAWQRVRISNSLATNGKEWGKIFSQYNSGTYNNQYMIIDLKKFTPRTELKNGALYIIEQIPGLVEYSDQTDVLRAGYWPSYNVPFHQKIYEMSGYPAIAAKDEDHSYQLAPRAKIFRRDQTSVTSLQGIKDILRFNNYKNDIYSEGDPCKTICCRGDLDSKHPVTDGCYDTKVTNYKMALNFMSHAISGPTTGYKDQLSPFSWNKFVNVSHVGMPETYNFDFVEMKPKLP